ncbi:HpcH/HpaI aldolase/citrate lyase family protein, partial [Pseudomonas syringae group genomosp. 7]|uniref:HpcH/HpaI aldolase/citrate lyase family protein n=1 Tax=Pseudomonas syringae group genomosp. 7 TaxID=251699 RepID=UPI003770017B
MPLFSPYALAAKLYMPATPVDLVDVAFCEKIPVLRSLVVCLEDAVALFDVYTAVVNLREVVSRIQVRGGRPANC